MSTQNGIGRGFLGGTFLILTAKRKSLFSGLRIRTEAGDRASFPTHVKQGSSEGERSGTQDQHGCPSYPFYRRGSASRKMVASSFLNFRAGEVREKRAQEAFHSLFFRV